MSAGTAKNFWSFLKTEIQIPGSRLKAGGQKRADWTEIEIFQSLKNTQLSSKERIELSFSRSDLIYKDLVDGKPLEESLAMNQKNKKFRRFERLSKSLGIEHAMSLSGAMEKSEKIMEKQLLKPAFYPLLLIMMCALILSFFMRSVLPSMTSWSDESSVLLIQWLYILIAGFIGAGILILAFFVSGLKYRNLALRLMNKGIISRMIQNHFSMEFAALFKGLHALDLSTEKMLVILKGLKEYPLIASAAANWIRKMNQGYSFFQCLKEEKLLSFDFKKFYETGAMKNMLETSLEQYEKLAEVKIKFDSKRISLFLQTASYGFVGLVLMACYAVLFSPLNAIAF